MSKAASCTGGRKINHRPAAWVSFQEITRQSLALNYSSNDSFDAHPELRIATRIVRRNGDFNDDVAG